MAFIRFAPDLTDAAFAAEFHRVSAAATQVDGYAPFNEQSLFDVAARHRTPFLVEDREDGEDGEDREDVVGAGILGAGELDLVVDPARRRRGHGAAALAALLAGAPGELLIWSHGDHPAARELADRFGFTAERTLLQLRLDLAAETAGGHPADPGDPERAGIRIDAFRTGPDDAEWVALNALVFAAHPEQGALTESDLAARQAEEWFSAGDFLVARDAGTGRMIGYNWLKIEPGSPVGEIYVVGVHPDAAGRGVGRRLMLAGLGRLRERGCRTADLYVEADSATAVALYRSLGFTEQTVDVQYRRHAR